MRPGPENWRGRRPPRLSLLLTGSRARGKSPGWSPEHRHQKVIRPSHKYISINWSQSGVSEESEVSGRLRRRRRRQDGAAGGGDTHREALIREAANPSWTNPVDVIVLWRHPRKGDNDVTARHQGVPENHHGCWSSVSEKPEARCDAATLDWRVNYSSA